MKTTCFLIAAGLLAAFPGAARAQGIFQLRRGVVGGGGGSSSGGVFAVTGTCGQKEAAVKASYGDDFALAPGFWAGKPSVQWPELDAGRSGVGNGLGRFVFTPARPGWTLWYSRDMKTWTSMPGPVDFVAEHYTVSVSLEQFPKCFVRLRRTEP